MNEIEQLKQRNAELAAQVSEYDKLINELIDHLRYNKRDSHENLDAFWGKQNAISDSCTCLAEHDREVAARAVEAAIKYNDACNSGMDYGSSHGGFHIHEFLEKIKSGEVQL